MRKVKRRENVKFSDAVVITIQQRGLINNKLEGIKKSLQFKNK